MTLQEIIGTLGPAEREVLRRIGKRLLVGQKVYGPLNVHDGRDWKKEAAEEAADQLVYLACAEMCAEGWGIT